jgi:hypothetical protein
MLVAMPRHSTTPLSKRWGVERRLIHFCRVRPRVWPSQLSSVPCSAESRRAASRLAAPLVVEGVEQLVGGGQQVLLLEAEQLLAAFADEQEAIVARLVTPQVEQHAGQVGGQGIETRLALVEHFQCGAVVGAMTGFAHLALDGRQQA